MCCLFLCWNYCILFSDVIVGWMQIGLQLILNSSNEDLLVAMLFSLSKLASICTILAANEVGANFILMYELDILVGWVEWNGLPTTLCKLFIYLFGRFCEHFTQGSYLFFRLEDLIFPEVIIISSLLNSLPELYFKKVGKQFKLVIKWKTLLLACACMFIGP